MTRSLIANMIEGVTEGFRKTLEIVGVGYRAEKKGNTLVLHLGFSHLVEYPEHEGIKIDLPNATTVVVEGIDRQRVGQPAAELLGFRLSEPFEGAGVRLQGADLLRE